MPDINRYVDIGLDKGLRLQNIQAKFDPIGMARTIFQWEWAPYQKEILLFLLSTAWTRLLVLAPPRHRKTSCVAMWIALELGRNPHLRVMVASHTRDYSALLLNQIEEIMKTPIFRRTFGDILPHHLYSSNEERFRGIVSTINKWTTYERHIPNRPIHIKDPSLLALSPDSGTPGFGADIIVADDLVSQANSSSQTRRRHLEHWFKASLLKRLEPDGRCLVVGARFYKADLYGTLLAENWPAKIYRASPEKPLWPAIWPSEALEAKQREDPLFFPAQYLQDPQETEGGILDPAWFSFYIQRPPNTELAIFAGIDPAVTDSTGSQTAYAVVGRSSGGQVLLLDALTRRIGGQHLLEVINSIQDAWAPIAIAFESNGPQQSIMELIQRHPDLRPGTNLIGVPSLTSKHLRLSSIAGYARVGKVLLPGVMGRAGDVEPIDSAKLILDAWGKFPAGNVDVLDAFEKAISLAMQGPPPALGRPNVKAHKGTRPMTALPAFGRVFRQPRGVLSPND